MDWLVIRLLRIIIKILFDFPVKFLATTISGGYLVLELRLAKPNIPVVPLRENLDENVLKGELVGRGDQIIGFSFMESFDEARTYAVK